MTRLLAKGNVENAIRCLSRHATPKAFTHLMLSGVTGRQAEANLAASVVLFARGHASARGSWAALDPLYKRPDGNPLHRYAGHAGSQEAGETPWADLTVLELYLQGHLDRYISGTDANGQPIWGGSMPVNAAAIRAAISPAGLVWVTGDSWAAVPAKYKWADGTARLDLDEVTDTTLVQYTEPLP